MGEYVAWTSWGNNHATAVKPIKEARTKAPLIVGAQLGSTMFEDWTEDGNLLISVNSGFYIGKLVVMDKTGKMVRVIDVPHGAGSYEPSTVSYRKYQHR